MRSILIFTLSIFCSFTYSQQSKPKVFYFGVFTIQVGKQKLMFITDTQTLPENCTDDQDILTQGFKSFLYREYRDREKDGIHIFPTNISIEIPGLDHFSSRKIIKENFESKGYNSNTFTELNYIHKCIN